MLWLILIFIIVPAIEIGIFLWTSAEVGVLPVLFMIVFTGVAGVALVRKEGKETWQKAQFAIYNNERPGEEILDGICIIISGACLLTPGFFTDIIGILLVVPFTRRPFKYFIKYYVLKKLSKSNFIIFRR